MRLLVLQLLLFSSIQCAHGQEKVLNLSIADLESNGELRLWYNDYWLFHSGNDPSFSAVDLDTQDWKQLNPSQITKDLADENDRIEGWFRLKIKLDKKLSEKLDYVLITNYGQAIDIYINGAYIQSLGSTGQVGKNYVRSNGSLAPVPFDFIPGEVITLAFYYVNEATDPISYQLMTPDEFRFVVRLTNDSYIIDRKKRDLILKIAPSFTTTVCVVFAFLFLVIYMQNRSEKSLKLIMITSIVFAITMILILMRDLRSVLNIDFGLDIILHKAVGVFFSLVLYSIILVFAHVFTNRPPKYHKIILVLIGVLMLEFTIIHQELLVLSLLVIILGICISYILKSWRNATRAQWSLIIGFLFTLLFVFSTLISGLITGSFNIIFGNLIFLSFPISLLFYTSYRFKEIISEVQEKANEVVSLTEEKRQQALNQQEVLELQVAERTNELKTSIENLKSTQNQLIHSEKMASLGELTAGIAHEIQNPLNFVNNFSDLNKELIDELKEAVAQNDQEEVAAILKDLEENESKITHHGKRAEEIVRSMLQHSRSGNGEKEPTNINQLADEYLRLAYHGLRAKDKSFNADFKTQLDPSLPKIKVIPQDIGRVLLNLINNAFQAVQDIEKPLMTVATQSSPLPGGRSDDSVRGGSIQITVSDNGIGIPDQVRDKIFQPFFTTKAAGKGTGLGLSMSYDIITKGHDGTIEVESEVGKGTRFIVTLPIND